MSEAWQQQNRQNPKWKPFTASKQIAETWFAESTWQRFKGAYFFYGLRGLTSHPRVLLSVSTATGAAPPVGVAAVHRHGAEDGGGEPAHQAQERRGERSQRSQLSQPLHTEAQRRQVISYSDVSFFLSSNFIVIYDYLKKITTLITGNI